MILVITSSFDKTINYIIKKQKVENFYILNIDKFSEYHISYTKCGFKIIHTIQGIILEKNCHSIYYRKPTPENLTNNIDLKYHNHCYREMFSLVDGIVESFNKKCLSRPSVIRRADNKILQTKIAHDVGFSIPDYSLTNSEYLLNSELDSNIIVKPLSSGVVENEKIKEYVQTNLFNKNKSMEALKFCPVYFQQYINKDYEVRVTIIPSVSA